MPENFLIDDAYIDQVIKANDPYDPNLDKTQGVKLRELIKLMRNRIDSQQGASIGKLFLFTTSGNGVNNTFTVAHGLDYVPDSVIVTPNSEDAFFDSQNLHLYVSSARIDGAIVVITCKRAGSQNGPKAGNNNLTWSIMVGSNGEVPFKPDAPTGVWEDTENYTFSFVRNPAFTLSQHEWRYRVEGGNFTPWMSTPALVLPLPEANIAIGDVQVRVKALGGNAASNILSNTQAYLQQPALMYALTINVSGVSDGYEVAYNGEVWPSNQKSFPATTIIENLVPSAEGYIFAPVSVSQVIMNGNVVLNFEATPFSTLLDGFSRIIPDPNAFEYQSDYDYTPMVIGGGGYPILGWRIPNNEDGKVFIRYENDTRDLNLYFAFNENNNDQDAVGFYFKNGNITWQYVSGGGYTIGEVEPAVPDAYYGLVKVGSNIKLYKTVDGLSFIELYDFGEDRDNFVYLTTYSSSINSVLHDPQGLNLISTLIVTPA